MAGDVKADRRSLPRFAVPDCEVYAKKYFIPRYMRKPLGQASLLVNISGGGMMYLAKQHIMPGEKLAFHLTIPAFIKPLLFRGVVVWSDKIEGKSAYRVGVRFTETEKESRRKLETLRKDYFFRKRKTEEEKNSIL